ncbi:MAG: adenine/guanine/hypoxanthine permease [Clostridiales bacterium]|nr:adenine/guanine/hypoxanthine permease [Clostridiales bacterium]
MDKFFGIKAAGSSVRTEIIAGITTFFTMAYIIFVNPGMLSTTAGEEYFGSIFIATCLAAAVGTLMMGLYARLPFAQAPGMGLNAFFAFSVATVYGYRGALAAVLVSGIIFIVITLIGLREAIVKALPQNLKVAISGGIGLFIAFVGLQNAGIIVNEDSTLVTFVSFSARQEAFPFAPLIAIIGVIIIAILYYFKVKGSILIGIIACTIIGIPLGVTTIPDSLTTAHFTQNFSDWTNLSLFKLDFSALLADASGFWSSVLTILTVVISFTLVDMFDTIGTLVGTAKQANMLDENGNVPNMKKAMMCDAVATTTGALVGSSTVTTYIESGSGISEGGRTGLTSVTTGILFILAIFLAPLAGIVPSAATAPALITVGVLMMGSIKEIDFSEMSEAVPAFLTMVMMPLTYSIATGIGLGLISYTLIKLFTGKIKDLSILTVVVAILFVIKFIL